MWQTEGWTSHEKNLNTKCPLIKLCFCGKQISILLYKRKGTILDNDTQTVCLNIILFIIGILIVWIFRYNANIEACRWKGSSSQQHFRFSCGKGKRLFKPHLKALIDTIVWNGQLWIHILQVNLCWKNVLHNSVIKSVLGMSS